MIRRDASFWVGVWRGRRDHAMLAAHLMRAAKDTVHTLVFVDAAKRSHKIMMTNIRECRREQNRVK